jgi:hypothetical protein
MRIPKATTREYLILPNHHISVSLNVMEDQVLSDRIEEDVNVQLPDMYNIHRWFFATAVGDKMKDSQAQQGLPEPLNMWPIHSMVQQYPKKKFCNSVPGGWSDFVHRRSAWAVSKVRLTETVKA